MRKQCLAAFVLSQKASQQVVTARGVVQSHLIEGLQGMADTLAFGQEERQALQMHSLNQQYVAAQVRMTRIGGLQEALSSLFMNGTAWVMLVIAIPLVRSGQLSGVFLPVLVLGVLSSFEAVLPLPFSFQQLGSVLPSPAPS